MMKKAKGYTLVEVVIAIAVGMIVIAAIYAAINAAQRFTVGIDRKVVAQQDIRTVLDLMAAEIQMASFNPLVVENIWKDPAVCTNQSTTQNYKGIQAASDMAISIEMDIDDPASSGNSDGVVGGGATNEIIKYNYDSANQRITRETSCGGSAHSLLGDTASSGNPRGVRVINTAAVPVFRYYNARGVEILPAGLPAGIPDIARIDITLWIETEDTNANAGQRPKLVYSTSVIPRNHLLNAGL